MAKIFQDILEKGKTNKRLVSDNMVREWYRKTALKARAGSRRIIRETARNDPQKVFDIVNRNNIGRLFLFEYDAKLKATLPYWDRFPIVFPFSIEKDGFKGLNLHYLPPILRARLMDAFHDITNNNKYDKTTKLKLSYELLKRSSNMRYFKPCIKHYLYSQLRTRLVMIPPEQWDIAIFMPLQQFQKANSRKVYADSRQIINKG